MGGEFVGAERLVEEGGDAEAGGFGLDIALAEAGEDDDGEIGVAGRGLDAADGFEAVDAGELHVDDEEIDLHARCL